jgi:heavy metal sensor kinase
MRLTLRARLTILYSAVVAVTLTVFATVAYFTVSSELYQNLDASLGRVGTSLLAVIDKQQQAVKRPLEPAQRKSRGDEAVDEFAFLRRGSMRDFIGPVIPIDSAERPDPVWSAVYEHMLFNSSTYLIQVADAKGRIVWQSDNLTTDTLPGVKLFQNTGASFVDGRFYSYYTMSGNRFRLALLKSSVANVTIAYPIDEIDATLRRLFSLLLWSMPAAFLVSIGAGWFLAQRSLRPIDKITRSARRITAQNLGQRLPVPETNDEIARLTSTLNDMIARLETSFDRIRQFTSDASHELKTPLAILMGELEIALRRERSAIEDHETLTSCLEEVERLTKVVQGLLDLSRADTGQLALDFSPVRLSRLAADVSDDVAILADRKHITFVNTIQPGIEVEGDSVRLHQALLNIIENAVKYTQHGGRIDISVTADSHVASIQVVDNGPGIPHDQLPYIFDRFYRVDRARSQRIAGTGLGLAITRWIVEAHGGSIEVQSQERQGTTFTISLPLRQAIAPA